MTTTDLEPTPPRPAGRILALIAGATIAATALGLGITIAGTNDPSPRRITPGNTPTSTSTSTTTSPPTELPATPAASAPEATNPTPTATELPAAPTPTPPACIPPIVRPDGTLSGPPCP